MSNKTSWDTSWSVDQDNDIQLWSEFIEGDIILTKSDLLEMLEQIKNKEESQCKQSH